MHAPHFAPQLFVPKGTMDLHFYEDGLGAVEKMRFTNEDGSIHVAEFAIGEAIFHVHEETAKPYQFSPAKYEGTTVIIGLFADDVRAVVDRAIAAGAILTSPVTDYDYGYRQGEFKDPFGHVWLIHKRI